MISESDLAEKLAELMVNVTWWATASEIRNLLRQRYGIEVSVNKVSAILDVFFMEGFLVVRKRSRPGGRRRKYLFFTRDAEESDLSD